MCIGLNQLIVMPVYKINIKYNVMKCQYVVLLLCFFVGSHNYCNDKNDVCVCVCVSPFISLELVLF
jgi:hypothetical protein